MSFNHITQWAVSFNHITINSFVVSFVGKDYFTQNMDWRALRTIYGMLNAFNL